VVANSAFVGFVVESLQPFTFKRRQAQASGKAR
jgi:hypothetical protein